MFNAGHSDENYRKLDLVEIITGELGRGDVGYVSRDEDPRDYKVSFERIKNELGFVPEMRVPDRGRGDRRRARAEALRGPVRRPLLQHLGRWPPPTSRWSRCSTSASART